MKRKMSPRGISTVCTGLVCLAGAMQVVGGGLHAQGQAPDGQDARADGPAAEGALGGDIVVTA